MKKQKFILISFLIVIILVVIIGQFMLKRQSNPSLQNVLDRIIVPNSTSSISPTILPSAASVKRQISVNIDFGDGRMVSEEIYAQTAYSALQTVAKDKELTIDVKQYKFGILVTKIGDKENSDKFGWIYLVNGKAGQIAADRYVIYSGNKVEWKYTKN